MQNCVTNNLLAELKNTQN